MERRFLATWDETEHVGYIYLRGDPDVELPESAKTRSVHASVILDLDALDNIIGIELILNESLDAVDS